MSLAGEIEAAVGLPVLVSEPMSKHTTLKIGGPADLFVQAKTTEQLLTLVRLSWEKGVPYQVLGSGSNVLVADNGIRGLVIQNRTRTFEIASPGSQEAEEGDETLVRVASGAVLGHLIRSLAAEGWSGLEWGVGVPGTVGGAVVGNAGAYGGSISQLVETVTVYRPGAGAEAVAGDDLQFGYRSSRWKLGRHSPLGDSAEVILEAKLRMSLADRDTLQLRMASLMEERKVKQPSEPSAGSVFKNPPHQIAGYLTEKAGLKGYRIGDAQVSPKHANYIVNLGGATASEVRQLIEVVREKVFSQFGIELNFEIELLGEW